MGLFKDDFNNNHFMHGWEVPESGVDKEFTIVEVPETTWAVFSFYGEHMESLPKIWTYLYTHWLLETGYKTNDFIFIEKEMWLDDNQEKFCAEVWLPLKAEDHLTTA